jgi:hypothetical protein
MATRIGWIDPHLSGQAMGQSTKQVEFVNYDDLNKQFNQEI